MRLVARAEAGQWVKATTEYERIIAKGSTQAMRKIGKLAVDAGRQAIGAAGFSSKFQRTLQAINKPKSGYVLNPSVYIHSTINYADIFETGKTIVGNPFLWLPLPNVPPFKGRPHMTPRQYIQNVGPLVTMRRANGLPMLGAVVRGAGPAGRITRARLRKGRFSFTGATRGKTHTVPMFVAVPSVVIPKKFDVKRAIEGAADDIASAYNELVEPYEGRH